MATHSFRSAALALLSFVTLLGSAEADILRPSAGDVVALGENLQISWHGSQGELSEVSLWSVSSARWISVDWWSRVGPNAVALLIPESFDVGEYRVQLGFSDGSELLSRGYFSVVKSERSPIVSERVTSGLEGFDVQVRYRPSSRMLNIEGELGVVSRMSIIDVLGRSVVSRTVEQGDRVVTLQVPDEVARGTYLCVASLANGSTIVVATISHVQ